MELKELVQNNMAEPGAMKVNNFEKKYKDYISVVKKNLNKNEIYQTVEIKEVKKVETQSEESLKTLLRLIKLIQQQISIIKNMINMIKLLRIEWVDF